MSLLCTTKRHSIHVKQVSKRSSVLSILSTSSYTRTVYVLYIYVYMYAHIIKVGVSVCDVTVLPTVPHARHVTWHFISCTTNHASSSSRNNNTCGLEDAATVSYRAINPLTSTVAIWVQLSEHPVPDRVKPSFVIYDIQALWCSASAESAWISKNYKWQSGTRCFIAVPKWQQWVSNGWMNEYVYLYSAR